MAVPHDMYISGYSDAANTPVLWSASVPQSLTWLRSPAAIMSAR